MPFLSQITSTSSIYSKILIDVDYADEEDAL